MDAAEQAILESVAAKAATKAVEETLLKLGINSADPIQAQQDFQTLRNVRKLMEDDDFVKDLQHIRKWRTAVDTVSSTSVKVAATTLLTGIFGLIVVGFREWLAK